MSIKTIFEENKLAVWITIAILIVGSIIYFGTAFGKGNTNSGIPKTIAKIAELPKDAVDSLTRPSIDPAIYNNMEFKTIYSQGAMKIFAAADSTYLSELRAEEGIVIPGRISAIIGYNEANRAEKEKIFSKIGDKIEISGLSLTVGGILKKTDTPIDEFYFIGDKQFDKLEGELNKAFVRTTPEGIPKIFYTLKESNNVNNDNVSNENVSSNKLNLKLKQGDLANFKIHDMLGKKYYPLIIGSREAELMKKEKLFSEPGDVIKNFFGKDVLVVGVLEETGSVVDTTHFVLFNSEELQ